VRNERTIVVVNVFRRQCQRRAVRPSGLASIGGPSGNSEDRVNAHRRKRPNGFLGAKQSPVSGCPAEPVAPSFLAQTSKVHSSSAMVSWAGGNQ
jgi:hypothetical protein